MKIYRTVQHVEYMPMKALPVLWNIYLNFFDSTHTQIILFAMKRLLLTLIKQALSTKYSQVMCLT